ncbi:uncharacterized protein LOC105848437 [Hydra vulgaris]|uniref:uncharacterized protein LOC105848437 n=1 Tax=Hydra vulgaris TaxID=6087 RepID=UPI0006416F1F|nr:uncharacterized protein LOC105848437 [Hydra vulgaris]
METVAERFIFEYEKEPIEMNFVELLNSFYQNQDTAIVKLPIKTTENKTELVAELTKRIFENFYNNPYFKEELSLVLLKKSYLEPLYTLTKQCLNKQLFDPNNEQMLNNVVARQIFVLHFSKCNFKSKHFLMFLKSFNSISIICNIENIFGFDVKQFCQSLLTNENLKKILHNTIRLVTNKECRYDCAKTELVFFTTTDLNGVNGYAGNNTIYLSHTSLLQFYYVTKQNVTVFKLNLLRLVQHEICHVALRHQFCNLNLSTPEFKETINSNFATGKNYCLEAGLIGECLLFAGRIDLSCPNLNMAYCQKFLQDFLQGAYSPFDPTKANAKIIDKPCFEMAIDFSPEDEIEFM